nr:MAG TPA: hypothetical protein [Caudoviricetes sp.]
MFPFSSLPVENYIPGSFRPLITTYVLLSDNVGNTK